MTSVDDVGDDEEKLQLVTEQQKHATNVKGAWVRPSTAFHDVITAEESKFTAESGRYHLYYSDACPWCHRVTATIALKGLQDCISMSNVDPILPNLGSPEYIGWIFNEKYPDHLHPESKSVWDIYKLHDPEYKNKKLTVPILFDKKTQKVVNNESPEIIVFLNDAFNAFAKNADLDMNPKDEGIQSQMTKWNDIIYPNLNDGVYRCGFARSQEAYDDALVKLFDCLDQMEEHLATNRYLCGDTFTLSDVRAWVTLLRFDPVYVTHFKCNLKTIHNAYPNLYGYIRDIYQMEGVKDTVDLEYTKKHYYGSHPSVNPRGIVAKGPMINYEIPHGREGVGKESKDKQQTDEGKCVCL